MSSVVSLHEGLHHFNTCRGETWVCTVYAVMPVELNDTMKCIKERDSTVRRPKRAIKCLCTEVLEKVET